MTIDTPDLKESVPLITSDEQQGLLRGVVLERSRPWRITLRFAFFFMPAMWLLCTGLFVFLGKGFFALFDALAWSVLTTTFATLVYHIFYPMLLDPPRLRLRNETLQLQSSPKESWSLPLDEPFEAHLLYRDHKEDALLIVLPTDEPPLFLYGRYRNHRVMPYQAIPISPLGFSLAEVAIDQIGAWMMPDKDQEYIAPLVHCLFHAPGYDNQHYTLPLEPSPHTLRMTSDEISLFYHSERLAHFVLQAVDVQPFVFTPITHPTQQPCLLFSLATPSESTVWVSIEWPLPLDLSGLPLASPKAYKEAIPLSTIDGLLFLHYLEQTELLSDATLLLQTYSPVSRGCDDEFSLSSLEVAVTASTAKEDEESSKLGTKKIRRSRTEDGGLAL